MMNTNMTICCLCTLPVFWKAARAQFYKKIHFSIRALPKNEKTLIVSAKKAKEGY